MSSETVDQVRRKFNAMGFITKIAMWLGIISVALTILGLVGFYIFKAVFVTEVKNYQIAFQFDRWGEKQGKVVVRIKDELTGQCDPVTKKPIMKKVFMRGWVVANPLKSSVYTLDMRPMQVQMNPNSRILNAKLVQFNPEGLQLFLSWHGLDNYEGPGSGALDPNNAFSKILQSYAYDGNRYTFLTILRELKQSENQSNPLDGEAQQVNVEKVPARTEFQLTTDSKGVK